MLGEGPHGHHAVWDELSGVPYGVPGLSLADLQIKAGPWEPSLFKDLIYRDPETKSESK